MSVRHDRFIQPADGIVIISTPEKRVDTYRDKLALQLDWDESQHPRDESGRFEGGPGTAFFARNQRLASFQHVPVVRSQGTSTRHPEADVHGGKVHLYPKFDALKPEVQDFVFAHEIGHWVLDQQGLPNLVKDAEELGIDVWDTDKLPFGQNNMHEAFADAFASYYTDKEVQHRYPAWATLVERYATNAKTKSLRGDFDESQHPRDESGKFTSSGLTYAPDPTFIKQTKDEIEGAFEGHYIEKRGGPWTDPVPPEAIQKLKDTATRLGKEMLARAVPVVRVPFYLATQILTDGRFKSQHESGTSKGVLDPAYRTDAEQTMFGTDPKGDLTERPIYGVFVEDFAKAENSKASIYGEVSFVLKDSVLDRTTVSFGDSLSEGFATQLVAPRPYKDFDWMGTGTTGFGLTPESSVDKLYNYAEAQVHGGVTLDDVKDVMVPHSLYKEWKLRGVVDRFQKKGIAVRVIDPKTHKAR